MGQLLVVPDGGAPITRITRTDPWLQGIMYRCYGLGIPFLQPGIRAWDSKGLMV